MSLGGYAVPAGAIVWVPFHALHNSEHSWQAPAEFLPERWMPAGGGTASGAAAATAQQAVGGCPFHPAAGTSGAPAASSAGGPSSNSSSTGGTAESLQQQQQPQQAQRGIRYMPFSDGSRRCIGQPLAMLELRLALIELLAAFRMELDAGMGGTDGVLADQRAVLTLEPSRGLFMRLTQRLPAQHVVRQGAVVAAAAPSV